MSQDSKEANVKSKSDQRKIKEEIKTLDKDFILWRKKSLPEEEEDESEQPDDGRYGGRRTQDMKKLQDVRKLIQKKAVNLLQMK